MWVMVILFLSVVLFDFVCLFVCLFFVSTCPHVLHVYILLLQVQCNLVIQPWFCILLVGLMSQIWNLTLGWSIASVPSYSPKWKIAFEVNDEINKITICSKLIFTYQMNPLQKNVINNNILQLNPKKLSLHSDIKWNKRELSTIHRHPDSPCWECTKFDNLYWQNSVNKSTT